MKYLLATGQCNKCGRYSEGMDNNPEDARLMLNHNHGHDYKCAFEGESTVRVLERKEEP